MGREQAGQQSVLLETSSIVFAGTESAAVSADHEVSRHFEGRASYQEHQFALPPPAGGARGGRRIVVALTEQGNRYSSSHSCWRRLVTGKGVATAKGGAIGREGATQYSVEQRCTRRLQIMLPTTRHCCAGHHVFEWASVKVVTHSSTKVERLGAKPSNVSGLWLIFSGSSYSVSSMLQKVKGRGGQGEGSMGWRFQIRCTRGLCHKQRSAAMQRSQG